jgi:hypothetical protein
LRAAREGRSLFRKQLGAVSSTAAALKVKLGGDFGWRRGALPFVAAVRPSVASVQIEAAGKASQVQQIKIGTILSELSDLPRGWTFCPLTLQSEIH